MASTVQQARLVPQKRVVELFHTQFWNAIKQTKRIHHNRIVPETLKHYLAKAVSHPNFIRQITSPPSPSYRVYLKIGNNKCGYKLHPMKEGAAFPTEQSAEEFAAYFCRETYIPRNDLFIVQTPV